MQFSQIAIALTAVTVVSASNHSGNGSKNDSNHSSSSHGAAAVSNVNMVGAAAAAAAASEQKRRENIRSEFDKIVSLTPTLSESENRSELNILTKSADFIDYLKDENHKLLDLLRANNIELPQNLQDLTYHGPTSDGSDVTK